MNPESAPLPEQPPVPQPTQDQSTIVISSTSNKKPLVIILIIILLLLLGLGAFYYFVIKQQNNLSDSKPINQTRDPVVTVSPTPTPTLINLDSSDTQLDKDILSINNKANNLATDMTNVDQGLSDKPLDNGQ